MRLDFTFFDDRDPLMEILGYTWDQLWEYMNLDDWDYGVITEGQRKDEIEENWYATRLLQGPCDNKWYGIQSATGTWYTVGIAYHA